MSKELQVENAPPTAIEIRTEPQRAEIVEFDSVFKSTQALRHYNEVARAFSDSDLVPAHFQGKVANCLVALDLASALDERPLALMQSMFIVKGTPGFKTAYMVSRAHRFAGWKTRIRYQVEHGENLAVVAWAIDEHGERIESPRVDMAMATAEGWTNSPKYKSMPEIMLRYRAAAFLVRLHAPEVMMGNFSTVEELETIEVEADVEPIRLSFGEGEERAEHERGGDRNPRPVEAEAEADADADADEDAVDDFSDMEETPLDSVEEAPRTIEREPKKKAKSAPKKEKEKEEASVPAPKIVEEVEEEAEEELLSQQKIARILQLYSSCGWGPNRVAMHCVRNFGARLEQVPAYRETEILAHIEDLQSRAAAK